MLSRANISIKNKWELQVWWDYYHNNNLTKQDGDGRPVSLSLVQAHRGIVKGFRIDAQPFWCNAVSNSTDIVYDGMFCNATNINPALAGTKFVFSVLSSTDCLDNFNHTVKLRIQMESIRIGLTVSS